MRELTYYVAVSLDGFIAGPGGEFDAFLAEGDHMGPLWERYRGTAPTVLARAVGLEVEDGPFDTVVMGWNTYGVGLPDHHLADPYEHLRQIVFTRSHEAPAGSDGVTFTDADPVETVRALKQEKGRGIWLCGGGALAAQLADEIDHLALKINPVLLGEGVPLFGHRPYAPSAWTREDTRAFASGVVLAEYARS
ncbi:dihydrofolate reductase family protein [Brachybacterium halotolerans subsp. kimchii]|uniref:dihydrofolate reductase family protein n=1 Tax=Brachybacterium halotolerans TaxID=2795215 RepID=UPI001E4083F3|nr:dihydrofolate reductase family protein [Brachybacterium halotolerans]UEJ81175.1 dihydrofolate reductase family protein [Brachybacterium halotolerans subsp. kimchii]